MSVSEDCFMGNPFTPGPTPLAAGSPTNGEPANGNPPTAGANGDGRTPVRHRLAEVREQQGVSIRSAARRMGVPMEQVRHEERAESNLTLADLARWQRALEVPLVDLLVDDEAPLSIPVQKRAEWLRMMKSIRALIELDASPSATRIAKMLEQQVLTAMPELQDVGPWHSVGQRRTQDELGRIVESIVPTSFARDGLS